MDGIKSASQFCLSVCQNKTKKATLSVSTTHLKAYQQEKEENVRCEQVKHFSAEVRSWLGSMNVTPTLQLFVGDLNSDPKPTFPWKGAALQALKEEGYNNYYEQFSTMTSYWAPMPYTGIVSFSLGGEEGLYDHIYYICTEHADASSLLAKCERLQERSSSTQIGVDDDCPSDHLPLLATFHIPK